MDPKVEQQLKKTLGDVSIEETPIEVNITNIALEIFEAIPLCRRCDIKVIEKILRRHLER